TRQVSSGYGSGFASSARTLVTADRSATASRLARLHFRLFIFYWGLMVDCCSEHPGQIHLEQHRRRQLVPGEILVYRKLGVRVKLHRVQMKFHPGRKQDALIAGGDGIGRV